MDYINNYTLYALESIAIAIFFYYIFYSLESDDSFLSYTPNSIPDHLQHLLSIKGKLKFLSRHILLYSVYHVELGLENESVNNVIRIKKPRRGFLFSTTTPPAIQNRFVFQTKNIQYQQVLEKAAFGLNEYIKNQSNASKISSATLFLRSLGFLIQHDVHLDSIQWNHCGLMQSLIEIGKILPWQLYVVYFTLPMPHECDIIMSVSVRGILKRVGHHSKSVIQKKNIKRTTRLESWVSHWLDLESSDEDELQTPPSSSTSFTSLRIKEQVIILFIEICKSFQFKNVCESLSCPLVQIANNFRKKLKWKRGSHLLYDEFLMTITACKLALPYCILNAHPDFFEFAKKNALHRYLLVFNHALMWDEHDIMIMYKGKYEKWDDVSCLIPRSSVDYYEMKGQYSQDGIIDRGLYEWTILEPFIQASPSPLNAMDMTKGVEVDGNTTKDAPIVSPRFIQDWGNRYILEVCSWIVSQPRLGGDHTWFRLKTPQGHIYSIGQYRPKKMGFHEQFIFPMKIKVSEFSSPDICEFWYGPFTTLSIEISENQFDAMKNRIEQDQTAKEHVYQLFQDNCVKYTMSIARLAGIGFPTRIPILELLLRNERMKKTGKDVLNSKYVPNLLRRVLIKAWVMTMNWISLVLGAGMVDPIVKKDCQFVEPFIRDFKDFTDAEKVIANHPFVIGEYVRKKVEEWRSLEISKLQKELDQLKVNLSELNKKELDKNELNKKESSQEELKVQYQLDFLAQEIENTRFSLPPMYRLPSSI